MTRIGKKAATAGAVLLATAGLGTAAAPAAHAEGSYNIRIDMYTSIVADYCLLTTTSGNGRAACSGNKPPSGSFRLGVVHNPGDRVWLDINVVGGRDRKGIDLQGKHFIVVSGDVFALKVCGWKSLASHDAGNTGVTLHGTGICIGAPRA
ncbi:hypothetical protein [Streptomyces sp. Go-475]|uniref:hypothetical protein n=1 Tax=Streptomyces sp. Go-475 TaxID=2072505 RepID=UPI000DEF0BDD|nr:hypothetical protein [Streptomyces sp. Go-475]AXE83369.1 hypothetical protein C1703_00085 [Streptomyces sp. Go-475]